LKVTKSFFKNRSSHPKNSTRLFAPDALRGLIMVLMALDHANHFVAQKHSSGEYWGGPFPVYHDALSFLTRFVTHLAAPGFFFLMGIGMVLFTTSRQKEGWDRWKILGHFWLRGGILISLQFLLINRAWEHSPQGWVLETYVGVFFALGGTMILGSLFLWLNPFVLLVVAGTLFIGTELLVPDPILWNQLSIQNPIDYLNPLVIRTGGTIEIWSNYPILPWLELVIFGFVFGTWLKEDQQKAFKRGLIIGCAFLVLFIIIRAFDGFGNIRPRSGDTWIHFLNVVKYPPSLTFTLLTTGINLTILWALSRMPGAWQPIFKPLRVLGQEPLFFYILHLFLYAGLGHLLTPEGTSFSVMYPVWIFGLVILYPICAWYERFKGQQPPDSVFRFL